MPHFEVNYRFNREYRISHAETILSTVGHVGIQSPSISPQDVRIGCARHGIVRGSESSIDDSNCYTWDALLSAHMRKWPDLEFATGCFDNAHPNLVVRIGWCIDIQSLLRTADYSALIRSEKNNANSKRDTKHLQLLSRNFPNSNFQTLIQEAELL